MGSILYDFLGSSVLFEEARISDGFASLTDAELRRELARYRSFCLEHLDELKREIPSSRPNSVVFSGSKRLSIEQLRRTALYVEAHVVDDPLFLHTGESGAVAQSASKHLGYGDDAVDRKALSSALRFLRDVTPMVAGDYVKFLPASHIYEPPPQVHITYSKNYFSDALPRGVLEFFHSRARVRSMVRGEQGWRVLDRVHPSRGLYIDFSGDSWNRGHVYHLHEAKPHIIDENSRLVRFELSIPDDPPEAEYFKAWLFQSMNQAARDVHNGLLAEYAMSAQCGAIYLARSQFAFDLLALLGKEPSGVPAYTATSLLEIDLPVLKGVSSADMMRARADGDAFAAFRNALERGFSELRLEKDPESLKLKTENFVHELTEVKVREVGRQITSLRKTLLLEAGIAAAGLLGGICGPNASLLTTAAAVFQGFKTYQDYQGAVTNNPAFLLWKLKRRSPAGRCLEGSGED